MAEDADEPAAAHPALSRGLTMEDGRAAPVHWPSLTADEDAIESPRLNAWVDDLRERYPAAVRLPECWRSHSDLVEAVSALRDYERYAFSGHAGAAGAVEWQRALRDVGERIDSWGRRLSCSPSDHQDLRARRTT
ncbi:MAG: hypothetical protein M3O28_04640 [Actinomycetota bacterium]|nr:hypothetical protein [Actinomycetota bacterium]